MALITQTVIDNLQGQSFLDEFSKYPLDYIKLAQDLAASARKNLQQQQIPIKSQEEFAERLLVRAVAGALLSSQFFYFRTALKLRPHIDYLEYAFWARSMARYVLSETIKRGQL